MVLIVCIQQKFNSNPRGGPRPRSSGSCVARKLMDVTCCIYLHQVFEPYAQMKKRDCDWYVRACELCAGFFCMREASRVTRARGFRRHARSSPQLMLIEKLTGRTYIRGCLTTSCFHDATQRCSIRRPFRVVQHSTSTMAVGLHAAGS